MYSLANKCLEAKQLVQAWSVSSKWVVSNHQGVVDPGELECSEIIHMLQDTILLFKYFNLNAMESEI